MKGLKTVASVLCAAALIAGAAPATAGAAAFKHYVACGLSQTAPAAHSCSKKSKKGAFFESTQADVFYTVCVKFPNRKRPLCKGGQEATTGTLYVNKITSNIPGKHVVTWFVAGKQVGRFAFAVRSK
jgi:hypothetical protein